MITIIDYAAGNLTSVARAVRYLGHPCRITPYAEEIAASERVIFPGVGSAGQAMEHLQKTGIDQAIRAYCATGRPFLGICLGTQIILDQSEEHDTPCLGIIKGQVKRFPDPLISSDSTLQKVPHMGWNNIEIKKAHPVLKGILNEHEFYFVHSYYPAPESVEVILGKTIHGMEFTSILGVNNIIAAQFHLEKSGRPGLMLLENFCKWNGEYAE
ncbi:MAG: imidazole glycerol phosphate synthase subunit HisH [Pseudomonadota bacterium]